jgi:dTDP-glucose 4,6-dehydratase
MSQQKSLLVLGSNSFAGGCLVEQALIAGYKVIGINRSPEQTTCMVPYQLSGYSQSTKYQFYPLDLNLHFDEVCHVILKHQPEYIVDLAGQGMVAESWQQPEQWYQTNVVAKAKLITFLNQQHFLKRYLRASTPEVYGSTDQLIKESKVYSPSTPYAVSHAAIDMHINAYVQQYNFPAIITRFSNFYGPTQQLYRIIPRAIIYAKLGKKLPLHGGGLATRAFIYGDDAASGILSALERGVIGESYHFSTRDFVTIRQLVEMVYQELSFDFDDMVDMTDDRPGKDLKYLMNDNKAQKELGWQPQVNLEQGIANTIAWVDKHWAEIKQQPFNYIHKV